jgi:hypothetical protein
MNSSLYRDHLLLVNVVMMVTDVRATRGPFFAMSAEVDFLLEPGKVVFDFVAAARARESAATAE